MAANKDCPSVANNPFGFLVQTGATFSENCQKIESDPNFRDDISDDELLACVIDKQGQIRAHGQHEATVIYKFDVYLKGRLGESLGNLYRVRIALKSPIENCDEPVWHVDGSVIIYAHADGNITFHDWQDVSRGELKKPLDHLSLGQFLNNPCLLPPKMESDLVAAP